MNPSQDVERSGIGRVKAIGTASKLFIVKLSDSEHIHRRQYKLSGNPFC